MTASREIAPAGPHNRRKSIIRGKLRPTLRTVLLFVNLGIVVLPLGSIFFFRIYENQLINQTEAELISQAAFVSAVYKQEIMARNPDYSKYGVAVAKLGKPWKDEEYTPIEPQLDFARQNALPPRPEGQEAPDGADALALDIGAGLSGLLSDAQKITLAGMKVLDFNGVAVAGRQELGLSFAHVGEVARAQAGHYTSVIRERISNRPRPALSSISRGTGIRLFAALPILHGERLWGVVYLSRTPKNILKHMYAERQKVIFAGLTILIVSVIIVLLTSYRISRPIHQLIARTKRASDGDLAAMEPLNRPGTREVELLSQSFAEMAHTLNERSNYIRDFATRVSHEFKTPLTSIQGASELLRDNIDDMPAEQRQKFLQNIIDDGNRLERLVTRLLELARADNLKPSEEIIDISVSLAALERLYQDRPINLVIAPDIAGRTQMAHETFETIASNLIENAIQHGAGTVSIDGAVTGGHINLKFADDGHGVSVANRDKIFTPFFTTRREEGGTGLGLDVVRSLIEAHDGSIALGRGETDDGVAGQSSAKNGAVFTIVLQSAA